MAIESVLGIVFVFLALSALIVLLFVSVLPLVKIEKEERLKRTKMFDTITKYLNHLMNE